MRFEGLEQTGVFRDQGVSGSTSARPGLDRCLDHLREGDVLTVWKLDRLGRNTQHVLTVVDDLMSRGIGFRSITEGLHTDGPMGKTFNLPISTTAPLQYREWAQTMVPTGGLSSFSDGRRLILWQRWPPPWTAAQAR